MLGLERGRIELERRKGRGYMDGVLPMGRTIEDGERRLGSSIGNP
jgi:hypothetical protein